MAWHDQAGRLGDPVHEDFFATWIRPADAFAHLPGGITPGLAATLLQRLKTRALVAASGQARFEVSPGKFWPRVCTTIDPTWWANVEGGDPPYDHPFWHYGDIRIVVPARGGARNTPVQFCDVRFERSGLEGLVPELRRQRPATPLAAPSASQMDGPREWISAADAVDLVLPLYDRAGLAQTALIAEAAGDRLATRCDRFEHEGARGAFGLGRELTSKFWRDFERGDREREDWFVGSFVFHEDDDLRDERWTRAFGVEFCANDIRRVFRLREPSFAVFPEGALRMAETPAHLPNQKRRGPKPKTFWGDAMAAVEAGISSGELLASSQADVERAMMNWIVEQGWDAGESTVRNYAKPVWERVARGGQ